MKSAEQLAAEATAGLRPTVASLLAEVEAFIGEYVAFPSNAALVAVTLWAAHAHALEGFESTPRLALISPEKATGKTRTLEVLDLLTPNPMHAVNCTSAALFRAVAANRPTLLFDEADTYFGPRTKREHEELRGLVNAGHRRGAVAYRVVGEGKSMEVRSFPAFAAVALAGLGDLPDTILDRAVIIRMRRRRVPDEEVAPFRLRKAKPRATAIRDRLAAALEARAEELAEAEPEMPSGITDRPADVWEALLAVADAAGAGWPERARAAAVELEAIRREETPSLGVQLLADIRSLFDAAGEDRLSSEELCRRLIEGEEAPWGDLRGRAIDPRGLASRLRPYGVRPHTVRIGESTPRGYLRDDFSDTWARYLPTPSPETATSATSATGTAGTATRNASATTSDPLTSTVALVADVADFPGRVGAVAGTEPDEPQQPASHPQHGRPVTQPRRYAGHEERELVAAHRELGVDPEAIAALMKTAGRPVPAGFVGWTGYAVRSFMNGWGGEA